MWTRLLRKSEIMVGLALWTIHSLLVLWLLWASLRNMELGGLWVHMHLLDRPVSLLSDKFTDAYAKVIGTGTYQAPLFWFHFLIGGLQFFLFGSLLGLVGRKLFKGQGPTSAAS